MVLLPAPGKFPLMPPNKKNLAVCLDITIYIYSSAIRDLKFLNWDVWVQMFTKTSIHIIIHDLGSIESQDGGGGVM